MGTPSPAEYGLGRMYPFSPEHNRNIAVFNNWDDVLLWVAPTEDVIYTPIP
jgi:hypothetical protein